MRFIRKFIEWLFNKGVETKCYSYKSREWLEQVHKTRHRREMK